MQMIDHEKQCELSWDILVMYSTGVMDDQEYDRLDQMIFSSDPENLTVAGEIITQLQIKRSSWVREHLQQQKIS